jgi:zinc protease
VERHDLPVVFLQVVVPGGCAGVALNAFWACRSLGGFMQQGTRKRSFEAIAAASQDLGGAQGVNVELERAEAHVKMVSSKLDEGLDLLADLVLHPTFPPDRVQQDAARWAGELGQDARDRYRLLWSAINTALYGRSHPYGQAAVTKSSEVRSITPAALRRAYESVFARDRATLIAVGDVSLADLQPRLERAFADWPQARVPVEPVRAATPPTGARVVLVDLPGSTQSLVYVAEPAITRDDPRYDAFQLGSAILGGFWMSRLNTNLRERRGWSYWVYASAPAGRWASPFHAGGSITADETGPAVRELLSEARRMTAGVVTDRELRGARMFVEHRTYGRFETTDGLSFAVADLVTYGRPLDEYATLSSRLETIAPADVLDAMRRFVHPDAMKIFVVGDRTKVESQLKELGMGPIEVRNAYGEIADR